MHTTYTSFYKGTPLARTHRGARDHAVTSQPNRCIYTAYAYTAVHCFITVHNYSNPDPTHYRSPYFSLRLTSYASLRTTLRLVGKGGEKITEIKTKSNCAIQVANSDHPAVRRDPLFGLGGLGGLGLGLGLG